MTTEKTTRNKQYRFYVILFFITFLEANSHQVKHTKDGTPFLLRFISIELWPIFPARNGTLYNLSSNSMATLVCTDAKPNQVNQIESS